MRGDVSKFKHMLSEWLEAIREHFTSLLFFSALVPALGNLPFESIRDLVSVTDAFFIAHVVDEDKRQQLNKPQDKSKHLANLIESLNNKNADENADGPRLILIGPEAHTVHFNRTVPMPRPPLACFLSRLADHLPQQPSALAEDKPVVALDLDVTPLHPDALIDTSNPAYSCIADMFETAPDSATSLAPSITEAEAMHAALSKLSKVAHITNIVFPRQHFDNSVVARNAFLANECCTQTADAENTCSLYLASPALFAQKRGYIRGFPSLNIESNEGDFPYFPGLGSVAFDLDRKDEEKTGALASALAYCQAFKNAMTDDFTALQHVTVMDALTLNNSDASDIHKYKFKDIKLGNAETHILSKTITSNTPGGLFQTAFDGMDNQANVYFVGVQTAAGDDVYSSPSNHRAKPGAWLHAAIYLSGFDEHIPWYKRLLKYVKAVGIDFAFGLILVVLFTFFLLDPVKHFFANKTDILLLLILLIPLGVTYLLVQFYMSNISPDKFYSDHWNSPIYVIVGLLFHLYLGSLEHNIAPDHHGKVAQLALLEHVKTFLWGAIFALSIIYGALFDSHSTFIEAPGVHTLMFILAAIAGFSYLLLHQRYISSRSMEERHHE